MEAANHGYLFITANVGSIFEEPEKLKNNWLEAVWKVVQKKRPLFLAVHFQEVGGKKSEVCRDLVHRFIREFWDHDCLANYSRCVTYLDEDYKRKDQYTALGSLYCIHDTVNDAFFWDFKEEKFIPVPQEKLMLTGTLKNVNTIDKLKFPLRCFPKQVWSRKGFMWTRWKFLNRTWDLVNIHLLHDASNVKALEASPSKYARYRQDALVYVFERLKEKQSERHALFGDFNTRLDTKLFIEHYLCDAPSHQIRKDGEKRPHSIIFRDLENENKDLLQVGSRQFQLDSWKIFHTDRISELRKFDNEFRWCESKLKEFDIEFLPSYPHTEDPMTGDTYSGTRCPSWCDRVMLCTEMYSEVVQTKSVEYNCIGQGVCVGDHKPVFLSFEMKSSPVDGLSLNSDEDPSMAVNDAESNMLE